MKPSQRLADPTFDINLAPILDIIVSIIPMLLLSIAFVQVKMIETPVPQAVADAIQHAEEKEDTTVRLAISSKDGFTFEMTKAGHTDRLMVPRRANTWDYEGLGKTAFEVKQRFPQVFKLDLAPEPDVNLNDLVQMMDKLRKDSADRKTAFVDPKNGEKLQTNLMFPNVSFANVIGD
jgi:biopolymer transport protein ExbD